MNFEFGFVTSLINCFIKQIFEFLVIFSKFFATDFVINKKKLFLKFDLSLIF